MEIAAGMLLFFLYVLDELVDWKASSFGNDLKEDLALLPEKNQEEHIQSFGKLQEVRAGYLFWILLVDIHRTAQEKWTEQDGPWHVYLERELVEFFPFDEKRASRRSKKRKNAAPIVFGLPRAPGSRAKPRGFAQRPAL